MRTGYQVHRETSNQYLSASTGGVSKIEMRKGRKVFEDISRPHLAFFNLMKRDSRIAMVWTRESNIFYQFKNERSVRKITGLYEGGDELGYQLQDVKNCFYFQRHFSGRELQGEGT